MPSLHPPPSKVPPPARAPDRLATPLQTLTAMLHAVFIQTADVFNSPQRQQPRAVIFTNAQVNMSIPSCNERLQCALDQLEMDLLKAKAALRRDLTALRAAEEARQEEERKRVEEENKRKEEIQRRQEALERKAIAPPAPLPPPTAPAPLPPTPSELDKVGLQGGASASAGGGQGFDEFLASLPFAAGHTSAPAIAPTGVAAATAPTQMQEPVGEAPAEDTSMVGGQPLQQLEDADLFGAQFDFFMDQGT